MNIIFHKLLTYLLTYLHLINYMEQIPF